MSVDKALTKSEPKPIDRSSYTQADFDFERAVVESMRDCPFFAMISRYIRKSPSEKLPTAGVCYDPKADDITMLYNREFMSGLNKDQVKGVLTHEFYHVIFQHITARRRSPPIPWNIATDLAINSIIIQENKGKLPDGCYVPGVRPKFDTTGKVKVKSQDKEGNIVTTERDLTEEEKQVNTQFADMIEKFPHGKASEWYFDKIMQFAKDNNLDGSNGINSFDDHEGWDDVPDNVKDLVQGKIKDIVKRAVEHADSTSDGWGNIPSEMRDEIRRSVSNLVDWRKVLKNFVGMLYRGERRTSFKRINKRYPYIHPGLKRGYLAKVLVLIDQSGSVDNESIERIFGELQSLSRKVSFMVGFFDTAVDEKSIFEWRKGQKPPLNRTRCGGTDFQAASDFANDPRNRGRWDGVIIATDGEAGKPSDSRIRRGWIIVPGRKLLFECSDMVVHMDDPKVKVRGEVR
jgi:predicted metal-dependent peptidase